MITLYSALPHKHSVDGLERWFKDLVKIVPMCNVRRKPMSRQYINDVTLGIVSGVNLININVDVYFLVTGHPLFNMIAYQALVKRYVKPFIVLVHLDSLDQYDAYSSEHIGTYFLNARDGPEFA